MIREEDADRTTAFQERLKPAGLVQIRRTVITIAFDEKLNPAGLVQMDRTVIDS